MNTRYLRPVLALTITGCAALAKAFQPPPPTPITVTYRMPTIAPIQGVTEQSLTKGGVAIIVTPATYSVDSTSSTGEVEMGQALSCSPARGGGVNVTPVRLLARTTRPAWNVRPGNLEFTLRITNQMPRVFRGAGTVVQFNVGGNLLSVPQSEYSELANLILPPRNEAQIRITGPALSSIPDGAKVGLFLYDVVTNTDAAGNITQKENFEWYFTYTSDAVSKQGVLQTSRRAEPIGSTMRKSSCS